MPVTVAPVQMGPASSPGPKASPIPDHTVMVLAVVLSAGSIIWFAWAGRPALVPLHLSARGALWWNAFLSLIFFAQHSVMVRRSVRDRLATVIPDRYDLAFYAITSGIVLAIVAVLFQRVEAPPAWVLHGVGRLILGIAAVLALALTVWMIVTLRTFDPCGLRPIRAHLRGDPVAAPPGQRRAKAKEFVVRGPFRWVRHPLYLSIIVLLWASPSMSATRFELALLWTAWLLVATLLEDRDLKRDFGDDYREYSTKVPLLIPWRRPVPARP